MAKRSEKTISTSTIEYDAEVAYIAATSPVQVDKRVSVVSEGEFDFSAGPYQLHPPPPHKSTRGAETKPGVAKDEERVEEKEVDSKSERRDEPDAVEKPVPPSPPDENYPTPPSPSPMSPRSKLLQSGLQYNSKTLLVYGPMGCGKTLLIQKLIQSNPSSFSTVVSHTTRRPRVNEIDGVDFHFVSHKAMAVLADKGSFIERVTVTRERRQTMRTPSFLAGNAIAKIDSQPKSTDSPTGVVELQFGVTYQSLDEAIQQGKPCIILNVSTEGAQQLKKAGVEGSYIFLHPENPKDFAASDEIQPDHTISERKIDHAFTKLKQYATKLIQDDLSPIASLQYQAVKDEWETRPTIEIERKGSIPLKQNRSITFSELLSHFQNKDLSAERAAAKSKLAKSGFTKLFSRSKLSRSLQDEKMLVLALQHCPINDKESLHLRALQSIYGRLTGSSINCRRFGSHWQDIGFGGMDPADDLQVLEVGFLGLLQLLNFLDNPKTAVLASEIFHHSQLNRVPFCVLSLNITHIVLVMLREGHLNKMCSKRDQVFVIANDLHAAIFYRYYDIWKRQRRSILQLGTLVHEIGEYAKKNVKEVMQAFEDHLRSKDPQTTYESVGNSQNRSENPFTPIDRLEDPAKGSTFDDPVAT